MQSADNGELFAGGFTFRHVLAMDTAFVFFSHNLPHTEEDQNFLCM